MRKNIKGWQIPTIKSVADELKSLMVEFKANKWDRAIEITPTGEVIGGLKPSLKFYSVGNNGGIVYEEVNFGYIHDSESDYKLKKMAKDIIENHCWVIENCK